MPGALLLFQAAAAISLSGAPQRDVPAGSADLSEVAARVHLNRNALEGWVPKKGTPPPPVDWESIAPRPAVERRVRRELETPPEPEVPETVNGFEEPRPWFYGRHTRAPRRHTRTRTFAGRAAGAFRGRFR